jgi:hypothetical protein
LTKLLPCVNFHPHSTTKYLHAAAWGKLVKIRHCPATVIYELSINNEQLTELFIAHC